MLTEARKDGDRGTVGLCLVLAGIVIWPVFFLLRWIFTGRWKGKPKAVSAQ